MFRHLPLSVCPSADLAVYPRSLLVSLLLAISHTLLQGLQSPVLLQLYTWGGADLGSAVYDAKNRVYTSTWHPPLSLRWELVGGVVVSVEFLMRERRTDQVLLVLEKDVELTWDYRNQIFRDWRARWYQRARRKEWGEG
eukprot:346730-Hanusia_phi.AAC.3